MGMLATVINGMALQGALEDKGMLTVYKPFKIEAIAEPYIKRRAVRHPEKGRIGFWRRNWKPIFHNRYRSSFTWCRNSC
jgi:uridylate kinase